MSMLHLAVSFSLLFPFTLASHPVLDPPSEVAQQTHTLVYCCQAS